MPITAVDQRYAIAARHQRLIWRLAESANRSPWRRLALRRLTQRAADYACDLLVDEMLAAGMA